jgi:hypothetical protein
MITLVRITIGSLRIRICEARVQLNYLSKIFNSIIKVVLKFESLSAPIVIGGVLVVQGNGLGIISYGF